MITMTTDVYGHLFSDDGDRARTERRGEGAAGAAAMRHGGFRRDLPGCLLLGLRHGAYSVGCCWALMALLLGVTNLLWMVLLALLVLLEKVSSLGRQIAALAGIALVAAGAWLLSIGIS